MVDWRTGKRTIDSAAAGAVAILVSFSPCLAQTLTPPQQQSGLRAPFDVAKQRAIWGRSLAPLQSCPAPPSAPQDLVRENFYINKGQSVADPAKRKAALDLLTPLWEFTKFINDMADDFVMSQPADIARARCVLSWLDAWSSAQALTGVISTWARYDTLWAAQIGAGMAYLKIREAEALDPAARLRVEGWLVKLAGLAVADNDKFNAGTDQRRQPRSNLSYWTAAGAVIAGIAANNRNLYDWGVEAVRQGLSYVTPEGALPAEMARQARAFVYHIWALEPLMLVTAAARANGADLLSEHDRALLRIVNFMLKARSAPAEFEKLAGFAQQADSHPDRWPRKDNAAALEIYLALRAAESIDRIVAPLRPVSTKFSGGNFTLLFGKPAGG